MKPFKTAQPAPQKTNKQGSAQETALPTEKPAIAPRDPAQPYPGHSPPLPWPAAGGPDDAKKPFKV